jgi:hypothetical protein
VTVSFVATDGLSGIVTSSGPQILTSEGAIQTVTGMATDLAGNNASVTVSGINIDKTAPAISGAATSPPNAAGWYNSEVTISYNCSDALSGMASCPAQKVLSALSMVTDGEARLLTLKGKLKPEFGGTPIVWRGHRANL